MKSLPLFLALSVFAITMGSCKKQSSADAVVGTWAVTSNHYDVTSTSPCQKSRSYFDTNTAIVTKVNDNTVNISVDGATRTVRLSGNVLDENANSASVGYYGNSSDILEWTLSGNKLTGTIKNNPCSDFDVEATKYQ